MSSRKRKAGNDNKILYKLCENAFNEIGSQILRKWLNNNKANNTIIREAATFQNEDNHWTPLHALLISGGPPSDDVDLVKTIIHHAPEILQMKSQWGYTPLHFSCQQDDISLEIVTILLEACPESVKVVSNNGSWLPIHGACQNRASIEVLDLLLQSYPESLNIRNSYNEKPSQLLKRSWEQFPSNDHMFLLHNACAGKFSELLIQLLLEAFPQSCTLKDDKRMIPLHYACENREPNAVNIAMALLDASPESDAVTDKHGKTSSQLLQEAASRRDIDGKLSLHHQAARTKGFTEQCLQFVFAAYPEGIALPDFNGMLPFHYACLNNKSLSLETLMLFLKLYPECIAYEFRSISAS